MAKGPSVKKMAEVFEPYLAHGDFELSDLRALKVEMDAASGMREVEDVLSRANKVFRTHGVESFVGDDPDDPRPGRGIWASYLNAGDLYSPTLLYDWRKGRFEATSEDEWREKNDWARRRRRGRY